MSTKQVTPRRVALELFNSVAMTGGWRHHRRLEWLRWAAWHQECPACQAKKYHACENLALRKRKPPRQAFVQSPHEDRIDYRRLIMGLRERGYITAQTYVLTLAAMGEVPE
jgi:hypothetical protein